jgi:kynurenine/2-aminoadipate aminotransferase
MTRILAAAPPEMIPLSGGFPNPEMFPFKNLTISVENGSPINLSGKALQSALQYLPTNGHPALLQQLKDLQVSVHKPAPDTWANTDIVVTSGSQDGLSKALEMLLDQGSSVLVEDFVYSGTLSIINPYKPVYHTIQSDHQGMIPASLRQVLARWTPGEESSHVPKFLYINPTGANPTGTVLPLERRQEIYRLCCEYNLLLLEDDPYYYLQFEEKQLRPPSFFSMDTEGRVLRFDSFSKILSSGIRLGFVTGPKPLIERIVLHMQVSVLHASSLSQVITTNLLDQWGHEGFFSHIDNVEKFYKHRRDKMAEAADKHLKGLCEYSIPLGGMFLWMKVPGLTSTWDMIMERGLKKNIMLMPGKAFQPDLDKPCPYLRAAFSIAPEEKFEPAMERLAGLIREELLIEKNR